MRKTFILAALAVCLIMPVAARAQEIRKPVVSIDDIKDLAGTGQSAVLRQMIETTVINTGKFRIMERGDQGTSVLLAEQQKAKAGLVTSNTPGKIGGFEGVDFKVYGTITTAAASANRDVGASTAMQMGGALFRNMGGALGSSVGNTMTANSNCGSNAASLAVDIRITDASTGELRYAKQITQTNSTGTTCGGRAAVDVNALMRTASERISMGLVTIMYPVKVVDTEDSGLVLLNYGEGLLVPGQVFALTSQGKEIRDPDTGSILGHKETFLGLVQVTEVQAKLSKAKPVTNFAALPPPGTVAREATPDQMRMLVAAKR